MPGFLGVKQNATAAGTPPPGGGFKNFAIEAAPLFASMAAGYSSGRGPYAYLDQGIEGLQKRAKEKRDAEIAAAASAAFGGLGTPGALGGAGGGSWGGGSGAYTGNNLPPAPLKAQHGVFGGGEAGISLPGQPAADTGSFAKGGLSFAPGTGMTGYTAVEAQYGLPEGYLARTAQIESSNNPNAQNPNSSAGGLFQFIDSTAQQYGLTNKFDPVAATDAAARLAADNAKYLRGVLGREPTAAELYLAHQQGAGGAAKILSNPSARAVDVVGAEAVRLNGGDASMSAGQFAQKWLGKFGGGGGSGGGVSSASGGGEYGTGAPAGGVVDPLQDPYVQQLMQVMAMPGLTPEQQAVVQMQLQSRIETITTPQPGAEENIARERRARDAELLGLQPGTPEFNMYVVAEKLPEPPEAGYRTMTPTEVQAVPGLDPSKAYQVGPKGEIKPIGGAGTSVTVNTGGGPELGKLSTDYGYVLGPDGKPKIDPATGLPMAAPVPGSPAALELAQNQTKTDTRETQAANSAQVVLQDIDRAIEQTSGWTAGMGSMLSSIPGTGAKDLESSLDTVRANIGFDRLQQMREASPTGGALGGIAIQELQMLQAVLGSLSTEQSPEQLKANLQRLKEIYEPIAAKAAAYPNAAQFGFGGGAAAPPAGGNVTSSGVQWSIGE